MSLRPQVCPAVPEETVRIARASFPKGSRYMRLRDELGAVFEDSRFAGLFPRRGRPAEAPWRLALVTLFQFAEGLPDRQAAEAVRGRIDWKYALALPLADPGFDSTVLQFVENLSDREAADAVRGRIDWKYALGLALTDPGFDHTVLSEFRTRLVGSAELLLLDALLERLKAEGLVKARGRSRTDSTHVLAAVRALDRKSVV